MRPFSAGLCKDLAELYGVRSVGTSMTANAHSSQAV